MDHKDLRVKLGLPGRMDHKDLRVKLGLPDRMDHKDLQEKYFTQIFRRTQSVRGRSKPRRGMSSQYWSPLWEARPHYSNPSLA